MKINYFNDELDKDNHKEALRWLGAHRKKITATLDYIKKAPQEIRNALIADFFMWDASAKYWSQWMTCRIRNSGVFLIEEAESDPQEGASEQYSIGEVILE